MQLLVIVLFITVLLVEHVAVEYGGGAGRYFTLLPELLSVILITVLMVRLALVRGVALPRKYGIFFALFFVHLLIGVIANAVEPGVLVAGFRNYLKFLPFFLLPALYAFSDQQTRRQLYWLLGFALLQLPFSAYQRWLTIQANAITGDWVVGTLDSDSTKMIFLMCVIAVLTGFAIKRRLPALMYAALGVLLMVPITLGETKATLFLLPMAVVIPALFYYAKDRAARAQKRKQLVVLTVVGVLAIGIFIPVYDHFQKQRWGYGLVDFFLMEDRLAGYLAPKTSGLAVDRVGRIDGLVAANEVLSEEPVRWWVGLGMGNASASFIDAFAGEYVEYEESMGGGALAPLLFELGYGGVALLLVFYFMVFQDARRLARHDSVAGAIALGWVAVVAILAVCLLYNYYTVRNVSFLFWYFSGYVAAALYRVGAQSPAVAPETESATAAPAPRPKPRGVPIGTIGPVRPRHSG